MCARSRVTLSEASRCGEGKSDKIAVKSRQKSWSICAVNPCYFQFSNLDFWSRHAGKVLGTDDPGGSKGLLKWKGVMFAPDDEVDRAEREEETSKDVTDSVIPAEDFEQGSEVGLSRSRNGTWSRKLAT